MSRVNSRLARLEAAQREQWEAMSDAELEAMIGPEAIAYMDAMALEDLERLLERFARGEKDAVVAFWEDVRQWQEGQR